MIMSSAATVFSILASAIIVLGGLVALVRAIWRIAQNLRDNTFATQQLTGNMQNLTISIDGRFDAVVARVAALEAAQARNS
jgi:hypothetical protein